MEGVELGEEQLRTRLRPSSSLPRDVLTAEDLHVFDDDKDKAIVKDEEEAALKSSRNDYPGHEKEWEWLEVSANPSDDLTVSGGYAPVNETVGPTSQMIAEKRQAEEAQKKGAEEDDEEEEEDATRPTTSPAERGER